MSKSKSGTGFWGTDGAAQTKVTDTEWMYIMVGAKEALDRRESPRRWLVDDARQMMFYIWLAGQSEPRDRQSPES